MKGAFKNAILVAVVLVVCALLLEVMTRLFVDDGVSYELEMWKYATDVKVRDLRPDMGHKHGPDRNTTLMNVGVRTESHGFRGPAIDERAAPGVARIAFVGDSTTMGWGVAEKDTFAHQVIEKLVKQGRKVDGFNEGVGNWNTTQELTNFVDTGLKMKPDIVVLTYFINDGEPMPTYPKESWLDLHSAAWIVLNYRLDSLIRQFGPRPDWKQYYRNLYEDNAPGWKATQKAIAGFAEVSRTTGVKIVVFHLPELRELKPYPFADVTAKVKKVVEENGLRFVDLLPTVENMDPASLWVTVPDPHPNAKADTAFADGMIRELLPMLDELCRTESKGC
ncbi:SGNH/GDSL hydrolase family protein [Reyranella sp.]|uniref:SGNH/GDSL hydrolase family protein n=1 Tax=Reyranella sp. TaxID=1929291 RepID=UPI003D10C789